jgi:2-methylcitrate dehydratase PrpD
MRLYEGGSVDAVHDGLGERFVFVATGIKKYPCCLCSHAAIEATLEIVRRHALLPADVQTSRVVISPYMHRIVGAPFAPGDDGQVAAQFSIQYAVASATRYRRFTLGELDPALTGDPALGARRARWNRDRRHVAGPDRAVAVTLMTRDHGAERPSTRCRALGAAADGRRAACEVRRLRRAQRRAAGGSRAPAERCAGVRAAPDMAAFFDSVNASA